MKCTNTLYSKTLCTCLLMLIKQNISSWPWWWERSWWCLVVGMNLWMYPNVHVLQVYSSVSPPLRVSKGASPSGVFKCAFLLGVFNCASSLGVFKCASPVGAFMCVLWIFMCAFPVGVSMCASLSNLGGWWCISCVHILFYVWFLHRVRLTVCLSCVI